jgi:uncharacterized membrane protein
VNDTSRRLPPGFEKTIGQVLRLGVVTSSIAFAIGLVMVLAGYQGDPARLLTNAGLFILLATPASRVIVSVIEYARERDWLFVVLTLIVLLALGGSVIAAFRF